MLQTLKKFFAFCGVDNRRMFIASIWLGVVSAIRRLASFGVMKLPSVVSISSTRS